MNSEQSNKSRWWHFADRVGAIASFLCAIHCALLPFVLALLPLVGLEFLADHRFERIFVLCACGLAGLVLYRGYLRHRRALPLRLAVPGLSLLLLGIIFIDVGTPILHSVLVTTGGLLLAAAHFTNLRLDRHDDHVHVHGPQCAH
ncbi:MerC domain-containing protein [Rhodanobacter sp. AS-Z3]|uniref:MerC domain-containing protein n=1 Tax=Rhodanobacter sp. AS-Z3 TaxID=3031330 RepID=UPI002478BFE8|nr:MerC domain-containing protein [Rhodanobacter sp. AS-Z3]WEN13409.1 MerC domain-containing protein [Rhodanobacter sp. AS-Z3]